MYRIKKIKINLLKTHIRLCYLFSLTLSKIASLILTISGYDLRVKYVNSPTDTFITLSKVSDDYQFLEYIKKQNNDFSTVYPTSNDEIDFSRLNSRNDDVVFLGIANLSSLDILANVQANNIFLTDINKYQLGYIDMVIKLIEESECRFTFLSNFYQKNKGEIIELFALRKKISDLEFENKFWRISRKQTILDIENSDALLNYTVVKSMGMNKGVTHDDIGKNVLGGIKVLNTILGTGTECINGTSYHKFPLIKPDGFLDSDKNYWKLKNNLEKSKYQLIESPLTSALLTSVCCRFKYKKVLCWTSNISDWYFWDRSITSLYQHMIKLKFLYRDFFDLTVLSDDRKPFLNTMQTSILSRKPSSHWLAFNKVSSYLKSKNVEIVNVEHWMKNASTLNHTEKIFYKDALKQELDKYECIFLHGLLSHGLDVKTYKELATRVINGEKRVIILEHNKDSEEITSDMNALNLKELKDLLGKPSSVKYVAGEKTNNRNMLLIYNE